MTELLFSSPMPVTPRALWDWHIRPGAFERLAPPWDEPRVRRADPIARGGRVELSVRALGPVRVPWVAEFVDVVEGVRFRDVQRSGPFARFEHSHDFRPDGQGASVMEDRIEYDAPFGPLGVLARGTIERRLRSTFAYRHRVLRADLEAHANTARPLRILMTGATGLVGRALGAFLTTGGHSVIRAVRREPVAADEVEFDPSSGARRPSELEGFDAVVHLAGANIAARRWTEDWKREIRESRVLFTRRLSETIAALRQPPAALISASAVGYYGDRGDRPLRESDPPGDGFLPDVATQWEAATEAARAAGIRVVTLRAGVVITPAGGALREMLTPFLCGVGGPAGTGRQWWSWIALDDLLYLVLHALREQALSGPVNATSPEPVRNADFARILGGVLRRPTIAPAPRFALRALLGEMADPLLLESARAVPERAVDSGFRFRYPSLEGALRHVLGRA